MRLSSTQKSKFNDKLFIVTAGPQSPNPAELLASNTMGDFLNRAEEQFDIVIIDGPPLLGLADALVISNITYGTVLVVDSGEVGIPKRNVCGVRVGIRRRGKQSSFWTRV